MKKDIILFLKSFTSFLIFSLVIYFILLFFWGNYLPQVLKKNLHYRVISGHMLTRLQEVKKTKDVDILFLGSSHAYRGFDPRIFRNAGFSSFNLGSGSQTPVQTAFLLKRYLHQLNPRIIIYEVNPDIFSSDGIESSLDIISNEEKDFETVKLVLKQNHVKTYNTFIYALLKEPFDNYTENIKKNNDTYVPGGYVQKNLGFYKSETHYGSKNLEWRNKQLCSFERIVKSIKVSGKRLILIQAPVTKPLYQSYSNKAYFDQKMSGYSEYFNFNNVLSLDDSLHFYDSQHLNQYGVEIFNRKIIETIF